MTEISLRVPPVPFNVQAQQQAEAGTTTAHQPQQGGAFHAQPPRCAVHGNETFVARGTPAADLAALFPQ